MKNVVQLRTLPVSITSDETGNVTRSDVVYTLDDGQIHIIRGIQGVADDVLKKIIFTGMGKKSKVWVIMFILYSYLIW